MVYPPISQELRSLYSWQDQDYDAQKQKKENCVGSKLDTSEMKNKR